MIGKCILLSLALFVFAQALDVEKEHERIENEIFKLISQAHEIEEKLGAQKRWDWGRIWNRLARYWNSGVEWYNKIYNQGVEMWNKFDDWAEQKLGSDIWSDIKKTAKKVYHEHADDILSKVLGLVGSCSEQVNRMKGRGWFKKLGLTPKQANSESVLTLVFGEVFTHLEGVTNKVAEHAAVNCKKFEALIEGEDSSVEFLNVVNQLHTMISNGGIDGLDEDSAAAAKRGLLNRFGNLYQRLKDKLNEVLDSVSDFYAQGVEKFIEIKKKADAFLGEGTVDKFFQTAWGHVKKNKIFEKVANQLASVFDGCTGFLAKAKGTNWVKQFAKKLFPNTQLTDDLYEAAMEMELAEEVKGMSQHAMDKAFSSCDNAKEWLEDSNHQDWENLLGKVHNHLQNRAG